LQIQVQQHPNFKRKGVDIWSDLRLKLSEAILGCSKTVDTVWGSRMVDVPRGTRPGSKIAIDGMGAPRLDGRGRGKHILEVVLDLPRSLNQAQLEAIEALQRLGL
jgi:molecular chaperone DnaJ